LLVRDSVIYGMAALESCGASVAQFQCSKGPGVDARLSFMGQSEDGKKIKVSLGGRRMDLNKDPVVVFFPPRPLRTAAAAFDAPNMYMDVYAAEHYLIVTEYEDEEKGGFHAQTLISTLRKPIRARSRTSILKGPAQ